MNKGVKIALIVLGTIVLSTGAIAGIEFLLDKGSINLAIRNAMANDLVIEEPEWRGESYEKVPYSTISKSDYLDLYVPKREDGLKPPLLVVIHGGGFVYNDSQSRQAKLFYSDMRASGYACASINYRLAQEAVFPACIEDCKAAIKFLKANADVYGYDASKVAVWGESAGGYLASMMALTEESEFSALPYIGQTPDKPYNAKVGALLDFYGILDFDLYMQDFETLGYPSWLLNLVGSIDTSDPNSFAYQFIQKDMKTLSEEERYQYSPTRHAEKIQGIDDLRVFITHGDIDITVPYLQSKRLHDTLAKRISETQITYRLEQHRKHADDRFYTREVLTSVRDFLFFFFER